MVDVKAADPVGQQIGGEGDSEADQRQPIARKYHETNNDQ